MFLKLSTTGPILVVLLLCYSVVSYSQAHHSLLNLSSCPLTGGFLGFDLLVLSPLFSQISQVKGVLTHKKVYNFYCYDKLKSVK